MKMSETPLIANGYDWTGDNIDYDDLLRRFLYTGFQATNFGRAVSEINKMLDCRSRPLTEDELDSYEDDELIRRKSNCTVFFGYETQSSSGLTASSIKFLVEHAMIDCIVTTPGLNDIFFWLMSYHRDIYSTIARMKKTFQEASNRISVVSFLTVDDVSAALLQIINVWRRGSATTMTAVTRTKNESHNGFVGCSMKC